MKPPSCTCYGARVADIGRRYWAVCTANPCTWAISDRSLGNVLFTLDAHVVSLRRAHKMFHNGFPMKGEDHRLCTRSQGWRARKRKGKSMAVGYFIRLGDKTTCGGLVIEADSKVVMFGMSHAREGDRVNCGMNGETCVIVGGISQPEMAEDIRQYCARFGYDGKGGVPDSSYGNDVTNVARLYELYPDQAYTKLSKGTEEAYLKAYVEGIGTSSGESDSFHGQGTGRGATGVVARVEQMPALVLEQLRLFQDNNPDLKISRIEEVRL